MKTVPVALLVALIVVVEVPFGHTFPSAVPSFLWSPHHYGVASSEAVNYGTLSLKDLVKSVMAEGGWSDLLCSGKEGGQRLDLALVFVGKELQSVDISRPKNANSELVDLLKASVAKSNFSLAFPYIDASEERESVESSLISEFTNTCGHGLEASNIAFSQSCSVEGGSFEKLTDVHSVQNYLLSRITKQSKGQPNLIVLCDQGHRTLGGAEDQTSEGQVFSQLLSYVENLGAKYTALYVSDPFRSIQFPSYREVERFLAEGTGNKSVDGCDGVCRIKSSFLEGIFVAIVLLIILISGLCCMMGIDTPTRFEAPTD
uniref:Putative ovule protein n=1 Tax=Solanum chacoense TaxID=4108 RepID=A0A0V0HX16_SOLCH